MKRWIALGTLLLIHSNAGFAAVSEPCQVLNQSFNAVWITECDSAIKAETNPARKSDLLFGRAYVAVDQQKLDDALEFLNQAIALNNGNWQAFRERAYVLGEFGRHLDALADMEVTLALSPDNIKTYSERAWSRNILADFGGSLDDVGRVLARQPDDDALMEIQIDNFLRMGRIREAELAIDQLRALGKRKSDPKIVARAKTLLERVAVIQDRSANGDPKTLCENVAQKPDEINVHAIGDCTAAYFQSTQMTDKAKYLTHRSVAWLVVRRDVQQSLADDQIAVALDPANPDWHSNLGYSYLSTRHSWAARNAFDRALALQPKHFLALAGRASAFYAMDDYANARRDAVASAKIELNPVAMRVAGNIAHDVDKDMGSARRFWLTAWKLGDHSDGLLDQLKDIGVADPDAADTNRAE